MRIPTFLAAYLAGGLILATPPAAAAQHMGQHQMGQQRQMGQQDHTQDMMRRMDAMIETLHQGNADLASRMEQTQGPMHNHQVTMLRMGQAMEEMAAQMRTMMEGMQGMSQERDLVMDQEVLRTMNQFHENMSTVMRQMEGPMRALHQVRGH